MWWQFGKPRLIPPEIEGRKAGEKLARKLKKLMQIEKIKKQKVDKE